MSGVRALRENAAPSLTQQIDVGYPLAPQVQRLNIDVPSRLVVDYEGASVGSIDLRPGIDEPLLPWIVRAISTLLRAELLLEVARATLPQSENAAPATRVPATA